MPSKRLVKAIVGAFSLGLFSIVVAGAVLAAPLTKSSTPSPDFMIAARSNQNNYEVFISLVMKHWPPIPDAPLLNPIDNPDGSKNFTVSWSTTYLAETYVLQEATNPEFSDPVQQYSGPATSWNVTGKPAGVYHYRVKASNAWGESGWSNTQHVTVSSPMAEVYVKNETGGELCFEVYDTGIGKKCFPSGTHFYGRFPSGTYNYRASAWCGSKNGSDLYSPGEFTHQFWCE
jgi:hypothetical protein